METVIIGAGSGFGGRLSVDITSREALREGIIYLVDVHLPQIRRMFDELWEAERDLLLWFDPDHAGPLPETCAP